MKCHKCGAEQPEGLYYCDECGASLEQPEFQQQAGSNSNPSTGENICPECGASLLPDAAFCDNCGATLEQENSQSAEPAFGGQEASSGGAMICPNCGVTLEADSKFCDMCGTSLDQPQDFSPDPSSIEGGGAMGEGFEPSSHPNYQDYDRSNDVYPAEQPRPPRRGTGTQVMFNAGSNGYESTPQQAANPQIQSYAPPVKARLVVQGSHVAIPFPAGKSRWIIGREDPVSGVFPDIDLTDHGGDEGGVSREHACISKQGETFYIEDLESMNYTFVNQQRVEPGESVALSEGAELRFGRVKLIFVAE
jgi:ribosomal protein L40E